MQFKTPTAISLLFANLFVLVWSHVHAHDNKHTATYLGNEAVLVQSASTKILFDPFFHKNFGVYQLVPEKMHQAIMSATPPFDEVAVIFISHAHSDHFSATDVFGYLQAHSKVRLVAPEQAVAQLREMQGFTAIQGQVSAIALNYQDTAKTIQLGDIQVEAVRIPHAGGASRREIENMVYRVSLDEHLTVIHMGDADPDDDLYLPHKTHWQAKVSDTAFPPYWFFGSAEGNYILDSIINTKQSIGVHVPFKVPESLKNSGKAYFSEPGEEKALR